MVSDAWCPMAGQLVSAIYVHMASDFYNCDCPAMYTWLNYDGKLFLLSYRGQLVCNTYLPMVSDLYNCDFQAMYTWLNCDGKWCMLSYGRSTSKWYICPYG